MSVSLMASSRVGDPRAHTMILESRGLIVACQLSPRGHPVVAWLPCDADGQVTGRRLGTPFRASWARQQGAGVREPGDSLSPMARCLLRELGKTTLAGGLGGVFASLYCVAQVAQYVKQARLALSREGR